MYILRGRLINGIDDHAADNGLVAIDGEKILYAGEADGYSTPKDAVVIEGETILPGFIDCHAHMTGEENAGPFGDQAPFGDQLLGAAYQAGLLLDAGFTYIRDMSEQGLYLKRAQQAGILRSPKIMPGGRCLGITGGHGDIWPYTTKEEYNRRCMIGVMCDGVDECVGTVREQFRKGAEFIKILATGGVSSPADKIDDIQFSPEEMKAIVDEAHRHHSYVTAHCTTHEGTWQALQAGIECVEHGVMLTQREIDFMAEHDIPLVSTLAVSLGAARIPGLPEWLHNKAVECADSNLNTIDMARRAGIRIALGTDFSNSPNSPYLKNGSEFRAMVRAGLTPMEAIKAGTINAAYVLRKQDVTGSLEAGKMADVVIVDGNPLEDIECLTSADHVKHVFLNGSKVK